MRSNHPSRAPRARGFTLIEVLVVVTMIGIATLVGLPALMNLIHRAKVEGSAREAGMLLKRCRFEAIKRNAPCVVELDPARRELVAFVDIHGPTFPGDPSDGVYNPDPGEAALRPTGTDYEIARLPLPGGVNFRDPDGDVGMASVDGFINGGNPDQPDQKVIYLGNGAAMSTGAIRLADQRGNYLQVLMEFPATGKTEIMKWDFETLEFKSQGQRETSWKWYIEEPV